MLRAGPRIVAGLRPAVSTQAYFFLAFLAGAFLTGFLAVLAFAIDITPFHGVTRGRELITVTIRATRAERDVMWGGECGGQNFFWRQVCHLEY